LGFGGGDKDIKAINAVMMSCSNFDFIVIHLACLFENTNLYFGPLRKNLLSEKVLGSDVCENDLRSDFRQKIIFEKSVKIGSLICAKNIGIGNMSRK
jgi:hypothetical protein